MANFHLYPGMYVRCTESFGNLKKDKIYQVLSTGGRLSERLSFVGEIGTYSRNLAGCFIEPAIENNFFEYKKGPIAEA